MIPGDYCRCTGQNCERKKTCERYVAWLDMTGGPRFMSISTRLCDDVDSYIPIKAVKP